MAYRNDSERAQRELDAIQAKSDHLTDQSLESTRRMVQLTRETEEVGATTMVSINQQGEQLNNIEQGLDTIHADVRRTEKTLTQMEKCCGCCLCPCGRSKNYDKDARHIAAFSQDHKQDAEQSGGAAGLSSRGKGSTAHQGSNEPYIQHITNDVREDEMDANMEAISGAVGNLKNMALDMGDALEGQNRQIDRINAKAETTDERLVDANRRAKKIHRNA